MSGNIKQNKINDEYKISRIMYIIEAALEYFISISVGSIYLARITSYIGLSDTITGILSSFVSLGCGFQVISIFFINKVPVKKWVTLGHIISQTAFALIYIVPICNISKTGKTVIFIMLLLGAHIIHNVINAPKINWFMSLVDDNKRGRFTANKEIVSLLGAMIYMYCLGSLMDYFTETNNMKTAFIICGLGIFILMIGHSVTLILSKEKPVDNLPNINIAQHLKILIKDKTLFKIIVISILYKVACYATSSFTGTYQMKELGFSAVFSSILVMIGSLIRVVFSRPMGKYADKHGFINMLIISFTILACAYGINIFTVPSNGKILFPIYLFLDYMAAAGSNSAMLNLVYDYVDVSERISALALQQTLSGIAGFLTTLACSPLIDIIQKNGNSFLGFNMYAQQIMSFISFAIMIILLIYVIIVCRKLEKKANNTLLKQ